MSQQAINQSFQEALALQAQGKFHASTIPLKKIVKTVPNHFPAWDALGAAHLAANKFQEATECLLESLKWCPEFYPAMINLARVLLNSDRHEEAEKILLEVLQTQPDIPGIHILLYQIYSHFYDFTKAQNHLARFIDLQKLNDTDRINALLQLDLAIDPFLDSSEAEATNLDQLHQSLARWEENLNTSKITPKDLVNSLFYLAYYSEPAKPMLERLSALHQKLYPMLNWTSPHCSTPQPKPKSKIKIGVVSSYLDKFHAVGFCYSPLIKGLNEDYTIIYFRLPTDTNNLVSVGLRESLGKVRCIDLTTDLEKNREIIATHKPDILWYTDIHMSPATYFLAHARLAPIQCVSGGHPCTTGIKTLDYFISSDLLEAPNAADNYTEQLIKLPTFPVIYEDFPDPGLPLNRKLFNLPENKRLYYCAQTHFKIHPTMDSVFKKILEQDPEGILVFSYADTPLAARLKQRLQKSLGSLIDQCFFIPKTPQHHFFYLLQHFDVTLDSFPFGGGNTICQAFSVGVPVVTLASDTLCGAGAAGLYKVMGIEGCVADNFEDYARKSVEIAKNSTYRQELKNQIIKQKHLIFNKQTEILQSYRDFFGSLST